MAFGTYSRFSDDEQTHAIFSGYASEKNTDENLPHFNGVDSIAVGQLLTLVEP
jgi:hypothetical protein